MNLMRAFSCLILVLFSFCASAQHKLEAINSGDIIKEVIKLDDDGKYQEAASLCHQVERNDTNYTITQYGEAYCFYNLGKYDTVIRMCRALIDLDDYTGIDAHILLGNAYDNKKQYEEAIKVYKAALQRFPKSYLLHFNLGASYYRAKKMDDAYESIKVSLDINPYHATSHYFLGLINAEEKRWAPALLAMHTCMILGPNKTVESKCLSMMINIAKGDYVPDTAAHIFSEPEDPGFAKADKLIESKMALSADFQTANKVDDPLMKQTQLLLETIMQSKPKADNYFTKMYMPMYTELMDKKLLKTFLYYPYLTIDNDIINKWKAKNKKDIQEFVDWGADYFTHQAAEYSDSVDGKPMKFKRYFYRSHNIEVLGDYVGGKKEMARGYWKVYFENTVLASQGLYDDKGKKTGLWRGYFESGHKRTEANYKEDKIDGAYKEYYKNGNTFKEASYKDGLYDGPVKEYYKNGALKSDEVYKAGLVIDHAKYYYENGLIKAEGDFKNGLANGLVYQYSDLGYKTTDVEFKDGKQDGKITEYHANGAVRSKGAMKADLADGKFEYYNDEGKLVKTGEFQEGKMTGVWKEFYANGKLGQEMTYAKGKAQGVETEYDDDGVKYYEATIKDDKIADYKYFDKTGKVVSEATEAHGELPLKAHYADGSLSQEGLWKEGLREGKWTTYYRNGAIKSEEMYSNGLQNGSYKSYFKNGTVHVDGSLKDGNWEGPYRKYFQNGKLESEEIVSNGKAERDEYTYLSNGAPVSHTYNKGGEEYKWQSYSYPDGKTEYEYYMDIAHMSKYLVYDTAGKVCSRYDNPSGSAPLDIRYFNGKPKVVAGYDKGRTTGEYKVYYSNGQLESLRHYNHGIEHGRYVRYYDNGKMASDGSFKYGKRDSFWTYYSESGKLESSGWIKNGDYTGLWTWYYENGKPERICRFVEDERDSVTTYFSPDGQVRLKLHYDNGYLLGYSYVGKDGRDVPMIPLANESGKIVAYYPNGNKSYDGAYKKGSRDGKTTYYYSDGKIQYLYNNVDGWRDGKEISYYPDGKEEKEEEYMDDDLHGTAKYFDKSGALKKEENYYMGRLNGLSTTHEGTKTKELNYYYGILLSEK